MVSTQLIPLLAAAKKPSRATKKRKTADADEVVEYIGTYREYDDEDYDGPRTRGKQQRLVKKNQMREHEVGIKKEPKPRNHDLHKDGISFCPVCGQTNYADRGCKMLTCKNDSSHPDGNFVQFCGHCHTMSTNGGDTLDCDCEFSFGRAARLREMARPMEVFSSDDEEDDEIRDSGGACTAPEADVNETEGEDINEGRTGTELGSMSASPVIKQEPDDVTVTSAAYHKDTDTEENHNFQDLNLEESFDDNQLQIKKESNKETDEETEVVDISNENNSDVHPKDDARGEEESFRINQQGVDISEVHPPLLDEGQRLVNTQGQKIDFDFGVVLTPAAGDDPLTQRLNLKAFDKGNNKTIVDSDRASCKGGSKDSSGEAYSRSIDCNRSDSRGGSESSFEDESEEENFKGASDNKPSSNARCCKYDVNFLGRPCGGNDAECFICKSKYSSECKSEYEQQGCEMGQSNECKWNVCADHHPVMNSVVDVWYRHDKGITETADHEWFKTDFLRGRDLTDVQIVDVLRASLKEWQEQWDGIVRKMWGFPCELPSIVPSGELTPEELIKEVESKMHQDVERMVIYAVKNARTFNVADRGDETGLALRTTKASGKRSRASSIENINVGQCSPVSTIGRRKVRKVDAECARDSKIEDTDTDRVATIECICCGERFNHPFESLVFRLGEKNLVSYAPLFRGVVSASSALAATGKKWSSHKGFVYAKPSQSSRGIIKFALDPLFTEQGLIREFLSLPMRLFINLYLQRQKESVILNAYQRFGQHLAEASKEEQINDTALVAKSAKTIEKDNLQSSFFNAFNETFIPCSHVNQTTQETFNNRLKKYAEMHPSLVSKDSTFRNDYYCICRYFVRYMMWALTGMPMPQPMQPNTYPYSGIKSDKQVFETTDQDGTKPSLPLRTISTDDPRNAEVKQENVTKIVHMMMSTLFDSPLDALRQLLPDRDEGLFDNDVVRDLRKLVQETAEIMAGLIHFHYVDVQMFVCKECGYTIV